MSSNDVWIHTRTPLRTSSPSHKASSLLRTPLTPKSALDDIYAVTPTPQRSLRWSDDSVRRSWSPDRSNDMPLTPDVRVVTHPPWQRSVTPARLPSSYEDHERRRLWSSPTTSSAPPSQMSPLPTQASPSALHRLTTSPRPALTIGNWLHEPDGGHAHRQDVYKEEAYIVRPMITDSAMMFIPPQRADDRGKLVVVLDLDETLVYARDGPVVPRPGLSHLLSTLKDRCEVVVWTAGERAYALDAIRRIDPHRCIHHCVYRHPKWWTGRPGYSKNLRALGRPLERAILVDNTPDCLRDNPMNSILVKDFGGSGVHHDETLYRLSDVIEALIVASAHHHVSDVLRAHPHVSLREVPCDAEGSVKVFTFTGDDHPSSVSHRIPRTNYDLPQSNHFRFRSQQLQYDNHVSHRSFLTRY